VRELATIQYHLSIPSTVQIDILDAKGRQLVQLVQEHNQQVGIHQIQWHIAEAMKGLYFARFRINDEVFVEQVLVQ